MQKNLESNWEAFLNDGSWKSALQYHLILTQKGYKKNQLYIQMPW